MERSGIFSITLQKYYPKLMLDKNIIDINQGNPNKCDFRGLTSMLFQHILNENEFDYKPNSLSGYHA